MLSETGLERRSLAQEGSIGTWKVLATMKNIDDGQGGLCRPEWTNIRARPWAILGLLADHGVLGRAVVLEQGLSRNSEFGSSMQRIALSQNLIRTFGIECVTDRRSSYWQRSVTLSTGWLVSEYGCCVSLDRSACSGDSPHVEYDPVLWR